MADENMMAIKVSRMGRVDVRDITVDMNQLVRKVLDDLKLETAGRNLVWDISELSEVRGDPSMLRLVISNLLANAIKYTRTCERAVIEVGRKQGVRETIFYVRDNGVGFDVEYADKLFGVFQRLHDAEEFEGTGIGLANVRRIIGRHGGRVWADSEAGKGLPSTFRYRDLWRKMMDSQDKILLVEDNSNDVELILATLSEDQVAEEVFVVRDGVQALDYLYRRGVHESRSAQHPRVVLLDLKLPKLDGLEVLHRIKTDPNLKTIPVVMLTSSREERDLLRSYDLGTNAYVVKPISFQDFVEAVREIGHFWGVINQPPSSGEQKR